MTRLLRPLAAAAALLASAPALAAPDCELATCTLRDAARHAGIEIGTIASAPDVAPGSVPGALIAREFTSLTAENAMKWQELSPAPGVYDFVEADAIVAFAEANGLRLRGHTLFWGIGNGPPLWLGEELAAAPDPAARLRERMAEHLDAVMGRWAGRIESWDVVNEPLEGLGAALNPESPFTAVLGPGWIVDAFRAARETDPAAKLFLNEALLETPTGKFDAFLALVDALLAAGAPIDGVGMQGHFVLSPPDGARLRAQIEALATRGLLVELTEVDVPLHHFADAPDPLVAQASAYAEVVRACAAVAGCRGVTFWGLSDDRTWLDAQPFFPIPTPARPLLFDPSLAPKPAYYGVRNALLAVPEPGSAALLALGLGALAARRRPRDGARR